MALPYLADCRAARQLSQFAESGGPGSCQGFNWLMELMSPLDSVFLTIESREHPMHVGGLQLFEPPDGAGPEFAREIRDALVANNDFQPTFRKHPAWTFGGIPNVAWTYDDPDDVDIDYHVRRSALPTPGDERELGILVSRLHGGAIDFHRPPWETHLIEGLADGRVALYTKIHHALVDGISAMRLDVVSTPVAILSACPCELLCMASTQARATSVTRCLISLFGVCSSLSENAMFPKTVMCGYSA